MNPRFDACSTAFLSVLKAGSASMKRSFKSFPSLAPLSMMDPILVSPAPYKRA